MRSEARDVGMPRRFHIAEYITRKMDDIFDICVGHLMLDQGIRTPSTQQSGGNQQLSRG